MELRLFKEMSISNNWNTILTIQEDKFRPAMNINQIGTNQTIIRVTTDGLVQIARYNGSSTSTYIMNTFLWKMK